MAGGTPSAEVIALTWVAGRPGGSKTRSAGAAKSDYAISPPTGVDVCPHTGWHGELDPLLQRINAYLVRWIRRKYKRRAAKRQAIAKMQEIARR
ncbi:hypothetical protein GCM10018966_065570 [Streptomyces yanii]